MRLLLALVLSCLASAAKAEAIHFVALAEISNGKRAQYDAFVEAVVPIWKRHGMTVLARARPMRFPTGPENDIDMVVLRVESRAGFRDYIADPDYRKIRQDRLDAVDRLVIFDGFAERPKEGFTKGEYLRALFLSGAADRRSRERAGDALHLDVEIIGNVKGSFSRLPGDIGQIIITPVDNDALQITGTTSTGTAVALGRRLR